MTLTFSDYLGHLRTESARFREVVTSCDPAARVPACPDWDASDLLWHLAEVQWSWARTVRLRPTPMAEAGKPRPERPTSYDALLAAFDAYSTDLVTELEHADPAESAWTWAPEQTVGFTYRRQAHEALVHRLDAEQTAGLATSPVDPDLAADGVVEVLDVMYGGTPGWGRFEPLPHHLEVRLHDVGASVWVQLGVFSGTSPDGEQIVGEQDLSVVADPGTPADTVWTGTAADIDVWLWKRGDDEQISLSGSREVHDRVRAILRHPLN